MGGKGVYVYFCTLCTWAHRQPLQPGHLWGVLVLQGWCLGSVSRQCRWPLSPIEQGSSADPTVRFWQLSGLRESSLGTTHINEGMDGFREEKKKEKKEKEKGSYPLLYLKRERGCLRAVCHAVGWIEEELHTHTRQRGRGWMDGWVVFSTLDSFNFITMSL